jgi:hypothetical protein
MTAIINGDVQRGWKGKSLLLSSVSESSAWLENHEMVYSWLQIWRPGFDSGHYQKKKVMGLERGPLSLVSTTEELLNEK